MLDIIGAVSLLALAFVMWRILIRAASPDPLVRRKAATRVAVWFAAVAVLAALGVFAVDRVGTLIVGLAVVLPVVAGAALAARSPMVRARVVAIPIATLVALNIGRALGAFLILLYAEERLTSTFANTAGWGDIAVAVLAIPVALAAHRKIAGWPALVLGWNLLGFADLITAVTLGVGSADSPLRFIYEPNATGTIATLPWVLIPGFLVPSYLLTHLAIFAQLRKSWAASAVARPARA